MSDFAEFLTLVENGTIVISVEKPQKEKPVKNSLASSLFNLFAQETTTTTTKSVPSKPKAKPTGKTLDFVVSDKELDAVLNPPANNTKPIDPKLQAFLEAFQKK
jgi:hypothetical protein